MLNPDGTVFATVIIVSFVMIWLVVSFTLAVKFITLPLVTFIVMFWLNWAEVASFNEKLKYCLYPDMFTIICPKLNPFTSVAFAVMFITSLTVRLVNDLFKVAFTIGNVVSIVKLAVRLL